MRQCANVAAPSADKLLDRSDHGLQTGLGVAEQHLRVAFDTVISINRANTTVETTDTEIAFKEVRKETSSLPKGRRRSRPKARRA